MFALWIYFFQKSGLCCHPVCSLARYIPLTDTFKSAWTTQCSKGPGSSADASDCIIRTAPFPYIVFVMKAQHRAGDQSHFQYLQREQSGDTSTGSSAQQYHFSSLAFFTLSCGYCIFTFAAKVFYWLHDRWIERIFLLRGFEQQKVNL